MKPNKEGRRLVCIRLLSRDCRGGRGSGWLGEETRRERRRRESYRCPGKGKLSAVVERRSQEMTGSIERCCRWPKQLQVVVNGLKSGELDATHLLECKREHKKTRDVSDGAKWCPTTTLRLTVSRDRI